MGVLPGRLGTLTAHDVMTCKLIVINESDTLESAIQKLKANRITGTPVVDDAGLFVGLISISDLLRSAPESADQPDQPAIPLAHGDDQATWDLFDRANQLDSELGVEHVSQRMSKQVTSVTEQAPIVDVARVMCRGHWHRVPVVDDGGKLSGIISTMDILAAIVNVVDEEP